MARPAGGFLELRTDARLASVRILSGMLEVALVGLGLPDGLRHDATLAVAELVANVCRHEYAGGPGEVAVRLEVAAGRLEVRVDSQGEPFDLQAALAEAAARDPLAALEAGGLGLKLVASLFDEVRSEHEDGRGNRVVLVKALG